MKPRRPPAQASGTAGFSGHSSPPCSDISPCPSTFARENFRPGSTKHERVCEIASFHWNGVAKPFFDLSGRGSNVPALARAFDGLGGGANAGFTAMNPLARLQRQMLFEGSHSVPLGGGQDKEQRAYLPLSRGTADARSNSSNAECISNTAFLTLLSSGLRISFAPVVFIPINPRLLCHVRVD